MGRRRGPLLQQLLVGLLRTHVEGMFLPQNSPKHQREKTDGCHALVGQPDDFHASRVSNSIAVS